MFNKKEKRPRINEEIRIPEVLLVGDDGETKLLSSQEALELAKSQEMDLIEVSPKAVPPVVKIADFGRFMYQVKKKEQKQKSHNKQTEVKMLRFGFRTEKHDIERLMDQAKKFLEERHLVKFVIRLRGREMTNKQYAKDKLTKIIADMADITEVEQEIRPQGNQFTAILRSKK